MFAARFMIIERHGGRALWVLPVLIFATSSFPVIAAGLNGFFDRFLELSTLAGIYAISRRKYYAVPFVSIAALAIHELFIIYGFPVICLAAMLRLRTDARAGMVSLRRGGFLFGLVCAPPMLFYLAILFSQFTATPEQLTALGEDIAATGLFPPNTVRNMVMFHLHKNLADNYALQAYDTFLNRLFNPDIAAQVFPATVFIAFWMILLLVRSRNRILIIPAVPVVAAPLLAHFVAWDTHRFSNFTIFQAFAAS